jgi:aspartate oxidase
MQNGDSPEAHAQDTLRHGKTNNPALVKILTSEIPEQVKWLEENGLRFDKDTEGRYVCLKGGGHTQNRILTCKGHIGLALMKVLIGALKQSSCTTRPYWQVLDLVVAANGHCTGAFFFNKQKNTYIKVNARATILTTGGTGALHPCGYPTTNHPSLTGEGLAAAYRAGARLVDMGSMQLHPTVFIWPQVLYGKLASEMMRSLGARLYNAKGEPFVDPFEGRDVIAATILRELSQGRGVTAPNGIQGVWFDTPAISRSKALLFYQTIYRASLAANYNFLNFPLLVTPAQHYQNGGIKIDEECRTSVPGLWAAGEVAGGVHGINRIGGNSIADILVFGRRAGLNAARSL